MHRHPRTAALGLVAMIGAVAALPLGATAQDQPELTTLTVRVAAAGAKWVSPELGGADVWVSDAESGEVLAKAQLEGDSGDTTALMDDARTRSQPLPVTSTSALAQLAVPLAEPRKVVVHVSGPRLGDGSVATASAQVWMVPGVDLGGVEGLVLEVHGLAVSFLEPAPHEVKQSDGPLAVPVLAAVEMLCGCPIGPDTPWHPDGYVVEAVAIRDGTEVARSSLEYAGTESRFSGSIELPGPGVYQLQVIAQQLDVANMGVARNGMVITKPDLD
jgi:hypothetical protein